MSATVRLLEFVQQTGPFEVDAENAVIKGVRILGLESANGRTYAREGVAKAIPLYEGVGTNVDHPSRPNEAVPVARRNGWLEEVKQEADGGTRGNWHLLKAHPLTPLIIEVAQRRPQLLGLSHNVSGKTRRDSSGREIVESIEAVYSVDVVVDPATTNGLHEGKTVKYTLRSLAESLKSSRPGYARALKEMADSGLMSPDAPMGDPEPEPDEGGETADHEAALKAGFRAAVIACLDDDSMDLKAKLAKLKEILTTEEKMLGGGKGGKGGKGDDTSDNPDKDMDSEKTRAAEESRRLKLENTGLRLLAEGGVRITKLITRALAGCSTEAEVKELVESVKAAPPPVGGKSAAPWQQSPGAGGKQLTEGQAPEEQKALAAWLRG